MTAIEQRVHERVLLAMPRLAARFPGLETAALVVGPDRYTVTDVIACGPDAQRAWATCSLDPDYLNPLLDAARARGLIWNAILHVHPDHAPNPSETDREAVRDLLNDPETGLGESVLFPITMRTARQGCETRFFLAEGKRTTFRQIQPVIMGDDAVSVSEANASQSLADALSVHRDARVWRDLDELAAAGFTPSYRTTPEGSRLIRATRRAVSLVLMIPPEYAFAPPEVYVEEAECLRLVPLRDLPSLLGWSSLRSLVDLANEAAKSVEDDREAESLIVRPRPFELIRRKLPSMFMRAAS